MIGANEDYFSGPYYIVFSAGMTEAVFNISVNDNNILEETETFNIVINPSSLPNNVTIGELDEAVITILDNDGEFYQTERHSHHSEQVGGICIHLEQVSCYCCIRVYSCNMGMSGLPEGKRVYISGKSKVLMLQLLCNTS